MSVAFYTIGHSTRSIEEFVRLLKSTGIRLLVDVRTVPRSRRNPQFNREILPATLADFQIEYEHLAVLGGLRGHKRDVSPAVNAFWRNQSFHNYADYAMTEPFRAGLDRLRYLGHQSPSVIMCAEAVWWQCHRRIIADYLMAAGEIVFHIMGADRVERAEMTEAAKQEPNGMLTYPGLL
jgi:uncharacterized protein (DUF488 family)